MANRIPRRFALDPSDFSFVWPKEKSPRENATPGGLRAAFLPGLRNSPRQRPVTGLKQSSATAAAKSSCSKRLKGDFSYIGIGQSKGRSKNLILPM